MFPIGKPELVLVAVVALLAMLMALLLGRFTHWSKRRVLWSSALPIPTLAVALGIYILVDAMTSSREECGVDACGMAAAAAMTMIVLAIIALGLSWGFALAGVWIAKR